MPTERPIEDETPKGQRARMMGRRQLLKTLITTGGAVTASALLPGRWIKPAVEVGELPSHAQVSPVLIPSSTHTPPSPTCYTPTPPMCYTPTPTPTCYTPTPTPSSYPPHPNGIPQPSSTPTPEARRLLLEQLLAEGRFPQDVARKLR